MGSALEAPTWPIIAPTEAKAVLEAFAGAGGLERLKWHSPRPFSAAVLVATDHGEFLLKRHHPDLRSIAALAEEHAFMAHLRAAQLQVAQVIRARDGASAVLHQDWTYELHRRAPGQDLYRDRPSWTPFLSHDHAFAAGQALARLHEAARGFASPERAPHPLVASFTILPASNPLAAAQDYVSARPALARHLAGKPWQSELARMFDTLGPGLADRLQQQPTLWTHNDWHPSNLLWSPDGEVSAVFDFGLAAPTCALHDLAIAIERSAIPWLDYAGGRHDSVPDPEAALQLLRGYRTVLPLTSVDIETIVRLLPLVHLEFALSEVDYFAGIVASPEQAELAWHGYVIDHADWFIAPEGRDFLKQLREGADA
ncbi:MAG: phosphotransferase [Rhizorhabdus sp.]